VGFIYKGYLLRSKSVQLSEGDRWTLEVTVVRKNGKEGEMREQTFSSESTFPSKELADMESIIFARKILDGEIDGISFDDEKQKI
jgi:hypothetical protein